MNDLSPDTVAHLYPVMVNLALCIMGMVSLITGLWVGFKWLHRQIEETSTRIVKPVEERVALVEKAVEAAHRRIDDWLRTRP